MATENSKTKKASKVSKNKPETKKGPIKKPAVRAKTKTVSARTKPARSSAKPANRVSGEERIEMIRTEAYFLSQQRGHQGDYQLDDWVAAERKVNELSA
jgi:N-acetylmuramoyl-L-alanine amidase CwlA